MTQYAIYHTRGESPCGGIAMFITEKPRAGGVATHVPTEKNPAGVHSSQAVCETCGKRFLDYGSSINVTDVHEV